MTDSDRAAACFDIGPGDVSDLVADVTARIILALEAVRAEATASEREQLLSRIYAASLIGLSPPPAYAIIGTMCDEELDRSGALLGRIRDAAKRIRAGEPATTEETTP